jgi:hypothetical protein
MQFHSIASSSVCSESPAPGCCWTNSLPLQHQRQPEAAAPVVQGPPADEWAAADRRRSVASTPDGRDDERAGRAAPSPPVERLGAAGGAGRARWRPLLPGQHASSWCHPRALLAHRSPSWPGVTTVALGKLLLQMVMAQPSSSGKPVPRKVPLPRKGATRENAIHGQVLSRARGGLRLEAKCRAASTICRNPHRR